MVGDQHADAALFEETDDLLNVEYGDRVDAGKRLVEQDKARIGRQGAGDFDTPPLAAGKRRGRTVADMADMQLLDQLPGSAFDFLGRVILQFEYRADVFGHRQLAEYRGFLRQIGDAHLCTAVDRQMRDPLVVDIHFATVAGDQTDNHIETRRLAGAVRP